MEPEMLYPDCPDMPLEVCRQCPYFDWLNESCLLTNCAQYDTMDALDETGKEGQNE